jgi:hypothetical protein
MSQGSPTAAHANVAAVDNANLDCSDTCRQLFSKESR